MRFETDLGKFVSAESRDEAAALAAQYGMGTVIRQCPDLKREPAKVRGGMFAAWCNLRQEAVVVGSLACAANAVYDDMELVVVYYGSGKPEKLNRAESAVVKRLFSEGE